MAQSGIPINFSTNAKEVAGEISALSKATGSIISGAKSGASSGSKTARQRITDAYTERTRADLSRQSPVNAINAATRRGITEKLDISTMLASSMLKGTKGADYLVQELNQGVGYALSEGLRPLKEASAKLREKASKTKNKEKALEYTTAADEIDKTVKQYNKLIPAKKAALRAFAEGKELTALERAATAFQKIGINVGDATDLTKFATRISEISPALAGNISALRDSADKISNQDYLKRLAEISTQAVRTVADQKEAFAKQLEERVKSRVGKGTALRGMFEKRFGNVEDKLTSGTTFDMSSFADQAAFSVFKDSARKTMGAYIQAQLDPKNLASITKLDTAKKSGDPAKVASALADAEKEVKRRVSKMYEELKKLDDIAKTTGDRELANTVNSFRQQIRAQSQTLTARLADGTLKVQKTMYREIDKMLQSYTTRGNTFRGSKTQVNPARLGEFRDRLDKATGQLISDFVASFKQINFQSFGGKTMAGAGISRVDQNVLNSAILAPSGYFSETTQEGRMDALARATELVRPALEKLGLSGTELSDAQEQLENILQRVAAQYRELANQTQGLNADQAQLRRKEAMALAKQGRFGEALKLVNDPTKLVNTKLSAGRPAGATPIMAKNWDEVDEQARKDRDSLLAEIMGEQDKQAQKSGPLARLRQVSAFAGSLLNIYGAVASAVGTVVNAVTDLVNRANELDKVSSTVNALGGSFNNFSEAMVVAVSQQNKYGGTLTETLQGLTSLVPLTKRYGADLGQLDNIARRLAVVDPLQGFQGASIALKEFFSGDITSLSRRFEIDRKSLNSIKAAGSQLEQLQALDKALSDMGISNDVLAAKTETAAIKFDRAGAAWDNFLTLTGKAAQSSFSNAADAITNVFGEAARELANLEMSEQYMIDLQKQIGRTASQFYNLTTATAEVTDANAKYVSGAIYIDDSLESQKVNAAQLVDEFNNLIEKLNEVRRQQNKAPIRYFSEEDSELINQLVEVSRKTGLSVQVQLENMLPTGKQKTLNQLAAETAPTNWEKFAGWASFGFSKSATQIKNEQYQNLTRTDGEYGLLNPMMNLLPTRVNERGAGFSPEQYLSFNENLGNASAVLVEAMQQWAKEVDNLPDMALSEKVYELQQQTGINYYETVNDLTAKLTISGISQEDFNKTLAELIAVQRQLIEVRKRGAIYEDKYITEQAKSLTTFGSTTAKDNLVKRLDDITQKQAESNQAILARIYSDFGGGAVFDPNNSNIKELLKFAKEKYNIDRETLYYMNELDKKQADMTLNANKTVSAYTALTNLTSGLNVSLQDAVNYAIEFKNGINSIASSSIFSQLSLSDRLSISSNSLNSIGLPGGPQNDSEARDALTTILGLRQEAASGGSSSVDGTKAITERYEKDRTKIQKDAEDERTKIMEDWSDRVIELIEESEYEKRAATADFYEGMFQNDNLTLEQQQQFSAQRESFRAEADAIRSEDPEKAKAILDAGEQLVKNEMDAAEKVAKYQNDNKEIDEDIADLQQDMSKAKDAADRQEIQRKIDKLNKQKLENQREIDQVLAVQKLRREADEQLLKDARAGINSEKEARDKAIEESKTAELKALGELKTQRDADLAEEKKNRGEASAAKLLNEMDYQKFVMAGTITETAARMAANGTPSDQVTAYLNQNMGGVIDYFKKRNTPSTTDIATYLEGQAKLVGSSSTGVNPALASWMAQMGYTTPDGLPLTDPAITGFVSYRTPESKPEITTTGQKASGASYTTPPNNSPLVTLPASLQQSKEAVNNNTTSLNQVKTSIDNLNSNLWYMAGKRG